MKAVISRSQVPDTPVMSHLFAANIPIRRPARTGPAPLIVVLSTWGALVALWAPAYLALLDQFGQSGASRSEAFAWALAAIGIAGSGCVLFRAWRDTRDPAWRASRGLLRRPH